MRLCLVFCIALIALSAAPAAVAQWLPWPPKPVPADRASTPIAPDAPVRLRFAGAGGMREIWADNELSGPVEVHIDSAAAHADFPLQRTLPARGSHLLARVPAEMPLSLQLTAIPGKPGIVAQAFAYHFPLLLPQVRIGQAPHGAFSHADAENRDAIDFAAPIGTPVIAAREGVVMQAEGRFSDMPGNLNEANFVRILHADGSTAVYAHLQRGSIDVLPGQLVDTGHVLARSGNSGYSSGPHLHFVVQVNAGLRLESVPVRIQTEAGELRLPREAAAPSPL